MGVLDDSDDSSSSDSDASAKRRASARPLNDQSGRMTPFARVKLQQQQREEELYQDFCGFAEEWLEPTGCVQKSMVVLYFREHFGGRKYKHSTSAEDHEIEEAMEKWNESEGGPKAEMNEFGLYLGVQINAEHDAKVKEQEALERRKTQVKLIIADSKRSGVKPPLDVLKEAMELGVIVVPKGTLESMKQVGGRQRRATMAVARHPPQPRPDSPEKKSSRRKKSLKRMGKSMGDIDFSSSKSDRKDRKKDKSPKRDKDKERKRDKASSSPSRRKSSSRMGKSMSDLGSSSRKSSSKDKDRDRDKEKKSSRKDKDKDEKKSSSRMHKSMGNLSYSPERERKSSKSKDKDKEKKSSSKDKGREKEKKSSSRDKDREKEKKSSSRKSSRRSSIS